MLSIENKTPVLRIEIGSHPIAEVEQKLILATLDRFNGDKVKAAISLGICLKTLYNKLERYEAA